ncbi:enoyl-CoA hydratase/isomerase family protein [Actinokineospora auranticolor]|uniref:Thioesterase DpgC n=1 Tax=Actinokineospora auranticolor TaxID=155976 RepID=A0A2S6GMZ2_9PSEU|nr:(3,5-dihydroxyphenyl)acetyl-CoA 1,2-dioxygenase DpgC [Actinokineospora auranticolor]PPK66536.1 thioesterase DpgC [Actinokineospora auranticolor]
MTLFPDLPSLSTLSALARTSEQQLLSLPEPADRGPDDRATAAAIHQTLRAARSHYLSSHVDTIYNAVTDNHRLPLRLPDLLESITTAYPGILPSPHLFTLESGRVQADKEGFEIDQAILLRAVLRSPTSGPHLLESMLRPTPRSLSLLDTFQATGDLRLHSVHLSRQDGITHLTLIREDCLNAEDCQQVDDMETAVDLALLDPTTHVAAVRGGHMTHPRYKNKRVFSSGINLKRLHAGDISLVDFLLRRELGYISKILRGTTTDTDWRSPTVEKPWLAAVDTFAIGGGAQLLHTFDRVIAASDSYYCLPAAQEGIVPGMANLRLTRSVGARVARQILLWGRTIHATDPEASLLFDEVVPPDHMDTTVAEAANRLDNAAVLTNRKMLNLAEEPQDTFRHYAAEFALQQALRIYSQDVLTKVSRFTTAGRNP